MPSPEAATGALEAAPQDMLEMTSQGVTIQQMLEYIQLQQHSVTATEAWNHLTENKPIDAAFIAQVEYLCNRYGWEFGNEVL